MNDTSKKAALTRFTELLEDAEQLAKRLDLDLYFHDDVGFSVSDSEGEMVRDFCSVNKLLAFLHGYDACRAAMEDA